MAGNLVICPLCGFEFHPGDTLCQHGCPLSRQCTLLCCPSCEYEFPLRPRALSRLRRLFRPLSGAPPAERGSALSVHDLKGGDRARVVTTVGGTSSRRNTLAVFGLIPGSELTLVQRRPAFVIRVGETELAVDPEIAQEILVEPVT